MMKRNTYKVKTYTKEKTCKPRKDQSKESIQAIVEIHYCKCEKTHQKSKR